MSIIRKEPSMIKATISNSTKRNAFAKAGGHRIARGTCQESPIVRGIVLKNYKLLGSGTCTEMQLNQTKDNVCIEIKNLITKNRFICTGILLYSHHAII